MLYRIYNMAIDDAVKYHKARVSLLQMLNFTNSIELHQKSAKDIERLKENKINYIENIDDWYESYNKGIEKVAIYHYNKSNKIQLLKRKLIQKDIYELSFHDSMFYVIKSMKVG